MTSTKYVFRAARVPSAKELHCLWSTLTDKSHINQADLKFRIHANGRQVNIISEQFLPATAVPLDSNSFEFLRQEVIAPAQYEEGQLVQLHGEMAYSVHSRATNRDVCPVDAFGRIKPELKSSFLRYLEKFTGLDLTGEGLSSMSFSWENRSVPEDKVWLNDVITFELVARVTDAAALGALSVSALGRRKSYGLGNTFVAQVVAAEAA